MRRGGHGPARRARPWAYATPNFVATGLGEVERSDRPGGPNDPGPIGGSPGPPGWLGLEAVELLVLGGDAERRWCRSPPGGINVVGAWENLEATRHPGAQGVTVAVLDSGVAYALEAPPLQAQP